MQRPYKLTLRVDSHFNVLSPVIFTPVLYTTLDKFEIFRLLIYVLMIRVRY